MRKKENRKKVIKGSELFKSLPEETRKGIKSLSKFSKADWKRFHKEMKSKGLKKAKLLLRT